jgi:type IV secretory pathway VirB10-like protein
MEVSIKPAFREKLSGFFLREKMYFLKRREINWTSIRNCAIAAVSIGVLVVLLLPSPTPDQGSFHEKADGALSARTVPQTDPTQEALNQLAGSSSARSAPDSLDHLYARNGGGMDSGANDDRASSMILTRGGLDSKTQLPPGSRLSVRLYEKAIVANQGMPVIGLVTRDFTHEDSVAIPKGSKVFGDVSFDEGSGRAKVDWRSIQLPDGRDRQLSAIGVDTDGQVGVSGKIHSDAVKNTVGQTLTRFIGAYAEGSMQRGAMGGNPGGRDNGWKNAIAETAKDRAESWAEGMRKEKRWIEISERTEFYAVLTQNFAFRDPGATYGR